MPCATFGCACSGSGRARAGPPARAGVAWGARRGGGGAGARSPRRPAGLRGAPGRAGAVTRGAPSVGVVGGRHEGAQYSGRAAYTATSGLTVGVSAARGHWIADSVLVKVPESTRERTSQSTLAADAEYGVGPILVRG